MRIKSTWKGFHKWVGLIMALLLIIFSISGIILNHRREVASFDISRSLLPSDYSIKNFNNGVVKGTLRISQDSILIFGNSGAWISNNYLSNITDYNTGLPVGNDLRNIKNAIKSKDGAIWIAAQFDIYRHDGSSWQLIPLPGNEERVSDITFNADSTQIIALTRSALYKIDPISGKAASQAIMLEAPEGMTAQTTLFKTFWMLHSGELFGLPGRLVVDSIAVVLFFLSISGIIIFFLPLNLRKRLKKNPQVKPQKRIKVLKWNVKYHNLIGYVTIILTLLVTVTGTFLRPPLMVPLAITKISPIPGTALDSDNFWHDHLRAIRWNPDKNEWFLSTSEGFFTADKDFSGKPKIAEGNTPPMSPMGINVFERISTNKWLIGSFSGIYEWNLSDGEIIDHISAKPHDFSKPIYATGSDLVAGFSRDITVKDITIIDYSTGAAGLDSDATPLATQPMALWNVGLELHVGRCYTPFLGPFSVLFVFVFGTLSVLTLISGLIILKRKK